MLHSARLTERDKQRQAGLVQQTVKRAEQRARRGAVRFNVGKNTAHVLFFCLMQQRFGTKPRNIPIKPKVADPEIAAFEPRGQAQAE